jgi:thiol-disulfide isomerase/thioredoxin
MMRGLVVGVILGGTCALQCCAQYEGTPAAKALDQKGHDAEDNGQYRIALADFRQAIVVDPDYAAAYGDEISVATSAAIQAMGMSLNATDPKQGERERKRSEQVLRSEVKEFEHLARLHPDKPVYLWALAQIYDESAPLKEEEDCRKAVAADPRFAPGYECLAMIANLRGDDKEYAALWSRVAQMEPDNAQAAFDYSRTLKDDPAAYKSATARLLEKFPADPVAAQALYWYASDQKTDAEQAASLEQLRRQFPPEKYLWSEIGIVELFAIEDRIDPAKARALVHDMVSLKPKDDDWARYAGYADTMATAEHELDQGHADEAVAALKSVKAPYHGYDMRREMLLNARALDASTGPTDAYALLLDEYAKHPADKVGAALEAYGAKLGKSAAEVNAEVWAAVDKASTPAIPFTLPGFDGGKPVSLADYRGHIVLVDLWFPNCGPCRQSFPHLENLAQKYKSKGVVVLAINVEKGQKPFVLPFLRSQGYDFIPLQADHDWSANVYHVNAYPTTFTIGVDGRQYFRPRLIDDTEERAAELEIEELLAGSG